MALSLPTFAGLTGFLALSLLTLTGLNGSLALSLPTLVGSHASSDLLLPALAGSNGSLTAPTEYLCSNFYGAFDDRRDCVRAFDLLPQGPNKITYIV